MSKAKLFIMTKLICFSLKFVISTILSITLYSQKSIKFSSSFSLDNNVSTILSNNFWNLGKSFNIFSLSLTKGSKSLLKSLFEIIIN